MKHIVLLLALLIAALTSSASVFAKGGCRSDCKPDPERIAQYEREAKEVETACKMINGEYSDRNCFWRSASKPRLLFGFSHYHVADGDFYVNSINTVQFITVCEELGGAPATVSKKLFCKIGGKHRHELKFSDYLKAQNKKK
ncbi:MAG: hypothetical protein NUW00_00910 [Candidatus Kaiserbacteria bacterium]|nr:hypothetical protein [Candidatus Kaiserbacteria bacterium]